MRALKITNSITRRDEKSLEKYLTEISRYEVLSPEEELALFQDYKNGNENALVKIIMHNLRFVVSVSKQYQNVGLWLGDLINEGNIGLIKAARRFDETKGFKFISYAVWWIRQSIIQALNDKSRKIRLPSNHQSVSTKIQRAKIEFLQYNEREPSIEELAEMTEFTREMVQKSLETYKRCKSLDAHVDHEGDTSLIQLMENTTVKSPDYETVENESLKKEINDLLGKLSPRESMVISMYYGLKSKYPMSLGAIGEHIGITRERTRQIKDRGLRKLRRSYKGAGMAMAN